MHEGGAMHPTILADNTKKKRPSPPSFVPLVFRRQLTNHHHTPRFSLPAAYSKGSTYLNLLRPFDDPASHQSLVLLRWCLLWIGRGEGAWPIILSVFLDPPGGHRDHPSP